MSHLNDISLFVEASILYKIWETQLGEPVNNICHK